MPTKYLMVDSIVHHSLKMFTWLLHITVHMYLYIKNLGCRIQFVPEGIPHMHQEFPRTHASREIKVVSSYPDFPKMREDILPGEGVKVL